jgi:hypothetical protein
MLTAKTGSAAIAPPLIASCMVAPIIAVGELYTGIPSKGERLPPEGAINRLKTASL